MKKAADHRKFLEVGKEASLDELKKRYRQLMKEWHPDKFLEEDKRAEAEEKSKDLINAYHFLVAVHPETIEKNLPAYKETTSNSTVADFEYDKPILQVFFANGSAYEYYNVPEKVYDKMLDANSRGRFFRRNIFFNYPYRKMADVEME